MVSVAFRPAAEQDWDYIWGFGQWTRCPACSAEAGDGQTVTHHIDFSHCAARPRIAGGCLGWMWED